jgi:serine/threonine protein kinase
VADEKITIASVISCCPRLHKSDQFKIGVGFEISRFAKGAAGIVYRCTQAIGKSTTAPLIVKLLRTGRTAENVYAITSLHKIIEKRAPKLSVGRQALMRGLPFWIGEIVFQGERRIALFCLDLDALGFVRFDHLLEPGQWKHYHKLDLIERVALATSFVRGCALLEELRFLHADVNTENLFVNLQTLEAVLIDFDDGVLLVKGDELPKTPGKPNEFLAPELKSKTRVDLTNEYAERWAVGFMVHTLIFAIHPLFFLSEISVNAIRDYLKHQKWPKIGLFALLHDVNAQSFYWHFTLRELHRFEQLRPEALALMKRFINDGALTPQNRPAAREWVHALPEKKSG